MDNASVTSVDRPIITREQFMMGARSLYTSLFLISLVGVVTNAINIRVFINQGLSGSSSTVSLFFLAISDLGACVTLVPTFSCTIIDFTGNVPGLLSCVTIFEMPGPYTHIAFCRLSSWITAYISVERGCSVILPLKVKAIFRPKVTIFSLVCMTVAMILVHYSYAFIRLTWVHHPFWNTTMAISFTSEVFDRGMIFQTYVFQLASPCLVLCFVIPSLILVTLSLRKSTTFRQKASNSSMAALDKESKRRSKENEILKAIAMVWGVYIVCQTINLVPGVFTSILGDVQRGDPSFDVFTLCYIAKFVVDNINASTNMFIYITISSSYKAAFQRVYRQTGPKKSLK